ncbi:MAG: DNA-methyltransferase [Pseudonocardia sp.]
MSAAIRPDGDESAGLPVGEILIGDAATRLRELPNGSVDCVITSPPYFGLRDYGQPGQLGAEASVEEWVLHLRTVCHEIARVLTPTGALWLNLGDGYSRHSREGAPKKSLLLGPQRVALGLVEDGWLLRNQIIWAKRNPMPSSVSDRLSCGYEVVLLLTRQRHYYFNLDAVRVPAETPERMARRTAPAAYPPRAAVPSLGAGVTPRVDLNQGLGAMKAAGRDHHPLGKNPGDVWSLPTANYREAHFATFPEALVERPLLSSCPARVCRGCGVPWRRATRWRDGRRLAIGELSRTCGCEPSTAWRPGIVLDPFMGAGTVAVTAERYERDWVGIELNPLFGELAKQRLRQWRAERRDRPEEPAAEEYPA